MKNLRRNYCSAMLILAMLTMLSVIGSHKRANVVSKSRAPEALQNEKAIEHLKQTGGYDSLSEAFAAARYKFESDGKIVSADNPSNLMQAHFHQSGEVQISGSANNAEWQTAWKLKSIGRGEQQTTASSGSWRSNGTRTELRREEIYLTEYFENRPSGLEQGFILDKNPNSDGDVNLRLIMGTSGELQSTASANGQTIRLSDKSGAEVLRYDKLKVWDANNVDLTARMTTNDLGEVWLEVEDAKAVYPITIDPTFIQRQKLTANDGESHGKFGKSVAISGDTAIIGAPALSGNPLQNAACVFVRNGTTWTQQAKLVPNDNGDHDDFGESVAISGNTVIVGSFMDDIASNIDQGSAYIFVRSGTNWMLQQKLTASTLGAARDTFGKSVAISDDTVLIGAPVDDIGGNLGQGSAFVFVRNNGIWAFQRQLLATNGTGGDRFGYSVSLSGSTAIIGAPETDMRPGAAYVFVRDGTTWTQQVKLIASDGEGGDHFGNSIDFANTLSGTIAIVGAHDDNVPGVPDQGSAYVFTRSGTTWTQTQKLVASDGGETDESFGISVSIVPITGSAIIVGAYSDRVGSNTLQGSAYVFRRVDSVWTQQQKLTAGDGAPDDYFGSSVAISSDTAIVGAMFDSVGMNNDQGSAYVFTLGGGPFDYDADGKTDLSIYRRFAGEWWYLKSSTGETVGAGFGSSTDYIVPADYDGDGKTDIAVYRPSTGFWYVINSSTNTVSYHLFGTVEDLPAPADYDGDGKADISLFRPSSGTWYRTNSSDGSFVAVQFGANGDRPTVGDFDGDGKADIAIFRPSNGGWYQLHSSNGAFYAEQFGIASDRVVPADYDGDGKTDIAIFRPSGGLWYLKSSSTSTYTPYLFGLSSDLPAPGDYDGDGKADIAVFRGSSGTWYLQKSTAGFTAVQFGGIGDVPTPIAYVR